MKINSFTLQVDEENIVGSILNSDLSTLPPHFVYLHGAGIGIKEGIHSIAPTIINTGINILSFDFSGHGESTGALRKSSLKKRTREATAVIDQFSSKQPLIVCGSSMGGYLAIKMLEFYQIELLILFCPALYNENAYRMPFDQGFTEIIRKPNSWEKTDVLPLLQSYTGKLLIIIGEKDEVIPSGVIDLLMRHSISAEKKELYIIPDCPHRIVKWITEQDDERLSLQKKILEFIIL